MGFDNTRTVSLYFRFNLEAREDLILWFSREFIIIWVNPSGVYAPHFILFIAIVLIKIIHSYKRSNDHKNSLSVDPIASLQRMRMKKY